MSPPGAKSCDKDPNLIKWHIWAATPENLSLGFPTK